MRNDSNYTKDDLDNHSNQLTRKMMRIGNLGLNF